MAERNVLVRIVVLALLLYSLACLASVRIELQRTEALEQSLQQELDTLSAENAALNRRLAELDSDEQIASLARERLGMIMPGEKIFYFYER